MSATAPSDDDLLIARAAAGDQDSLGLLLHRDHERLRRMISLRLDRRMQGRVDPSDVIQESQLEATRRLPEYIANPCMPFFLWLRLIAGQKIIQLHRYHLGVKMRAAGREVSLFRRALPEATTAALADKLLGRDSEPDAAAQRAELSIRLQVALNAMDSVDREVLTLRHFEQLTTAETAAELEITVEATKKRHLRALKRLKEMLEQLGGDFEELAP